MPKLTKMEKSKQQKSKDRTAELGKLLKTQTAVVRKAELEEAANSKRGKAKNNAARKSSSFATALDVLRESETSKGDVRSTKEQINNDDKSKRGIEALKKKMRADMENQTKDATNKKATQAPAVIPRGSTHQLPRVTKQSQKSKKPSSAKIVQQIPVSISDDESEEDSEVDSEEEQNDDTQTPPRNSFHPEKVLRLLEQIGDPELLQEWFEDYGLQNSPVLTRFRDVCSLIAKSLKHWKTPNDANLDRFFIYRTRKKELMLLAPIETFQGIRNLQGKTFGFVRPKGNYYPLFTSISGWSFSSRTNKKMLDPDVETANVKRFCKIYDIKLSSGWTHGRDDVGVPESHVEKKLMLHYASHLLAKATGKAPDISNFEKLRNAKRRPEAEIILSERPCKSCWRFQKRIEEITGVKFTFYAHPNLGKIVKRRGATGAYSYYPKDPCDLEDQEGNCEEPEDLSEHTATRKISKKVTKVTTVVSTREMTTQKKRKGFDHEDDWDNALWEPPNPTPAKKHKADATPTAKTFTRSKNAIMTPPSTPSTPSANFEIRLPSYKETSKQSIPESPAASKASRKLLERFGYKEAVTKNVHNAKHTHYYD